MMADADTAKTAEGIVVGGLAIQIIGFGIFIVVMIIFQRRMNANPTDEARNPASTWKQDMVTLYIASVLIMIRSVFRVIEFVLGNDSYLFQYEWPLYVFDIGLMLIMMIIFIMRYPGYPSLLKKLRFSGKKNERGLELA